MKHNTNNCVKNFSLLPNHCFGFVFVNDTKVGFTNIIPDTQPVYINHLNWTIIKKNFFVYPVYGTPSTIHDGAKAIEILEKWGQERNDVWG